MPTRAKSTGWTGSDDGHGRALETIWLKACAAAVIVALLQAVLTAVAFHWWAEEPLTGELDRKALAVGQAMKTEMERAARVGIPLAELRGVEPFFSVFSMTIRISASSL